MTDTSSTSTPLRLEVWSDLGCPWCYIGQHRLQQAIEARGDGDRFEVRIRSFELDPNAERTPEPIADMFVRRYGGDVARFRQLEAGVAGIARADGLDYEEDRPAASSFDVHRLHHLAEEHGLGTAFFTQVQTGYFTGRLNPFDPAELTDAAVASGLPRERVTEVLAGDDYADAVRKDEAQAHGYGATGVPFVVYDGRFATSGAQDVASYGEVLQRLLPLATPGRSA